MKLSQIYKTYRTPPNLQEHMQKVARVAGLICQHWSGPKIDSLLIKKAALVHDLGNIVRFDIKSHPEFLGKEKTRADFWEKTQKEMVSQYGNDDHQATAQMLKEIGLEDKIIQLVLIKGFKNVLSIEKSKIWELKILLYADMRVGPFGVIPLAERIDEAISRWKKVDKNKWEGHIEACKRIEEQIQERVNLDLQKINQDLMGNRDFSDFEI